MSLKHNRYAAAVLLSGLLYAGFADAAPAARSDVQQAPKASFGIGLGGGIGSVHGDGCDRNQDCDGTGTLFLGSAHVNVFMGPFTIGGRYVGQLDNDGHASEAAGLIGIRPGRSPVSLMVGPGKIYDANDESKHAISVLSWEVLIAPHGSNVQFIVHGASGDADYVAFTFATSFGEQ